MSKLPTRHQIKAWSAAVHEHTDGCYSPYGPCGEYHVHDDQCGGRGRSLWCHRTQTPGLREVCDAATAALNIADLLRVPPDGDVLKYVQQARDALDGFNLRFPAVSARVTELEAERDQLKAELDKWVETANMGLANFDALAADLTAERERTARAIALLNAILPPRGCLEWKVSATTMARWRNELLALNAPTEPKG